MSGDVGPAQVIDAHHHLWRYSPEEFGWLDEGMQALQRDFLLEDLARETAAAGVDATVAVQARQSLEETGWLLDIAEQTPLIAGVVGWAPLASPDFERVLEEFTGRPKLKGLRHVIQGEADDDFILGADFNRGIRAMRKTGLVYDILIFARHLPQTIQFVDRHPGQVFVLDHVAKPSISAGIGFDAWARGMRELGKRENVFCKVSGMVTEADWKTWQPETLQPYFDVVLEAFGPARLMAGSDWPVCLVASGYTQWFSVLRTYFATLTSTERDQVFGTTAAAIYHL